MDGAEGEVGMGVRESKKNNQQRAQFQLGLRGKYSLKQSENSSELKVNFREEKKKPRLTQKPIWVKKFRVLRPLRTFQKLSNYVRRIREETRECPYEQSGIRQMDSDQYFWKQVEYKQKIVVQMTGPQYLKNTYILTLGVKIKIM